MKRTTRLGGKRKGKPIRQNRPSWRKERTYVTNPKNPRWRKIKKKTKEWKMLKDEKY